MKKRLVKYELTKINLKNLPRDFGIYIFWNINKKPIYVGKSNNIRKRIRSYFSEILIGRTARMISTVKFFSYVRVTSELEALLLEASLVKILNPKYNIQLKDDKHPLYIRITKDKYPQVLTARRLEENYNNLAFFGPFPSSANVKYVLKMIRKIFPFSQHKVAKRECFYSQIGLCQPCPSIIENLKDSMQKIILQKKYLRNIKLIIKVLSRKQNYVRKSLEKHMQILSKNEYFEEAQNIRDQIRNLDYINQPMRNVSLFLENPNMIDDIRKVEIISLKRSLNPYIKIKKLKRIECFDVAHLSGTYPTASMVTFIKGESEKSLYRHFKIIKGNPNDDISYLKEIAQRRAKYFQQWGIPDLIIVDGGKAQVGIFLDELRSYGIPIIGFAKKFETVFVPLNTIRELKFKEIRLNEEPALFLLQRIRDEAHRFARRLHHKLLNREMIRKND